MNIEWTLLLLRRELQGFSKELELFPDEELIWRTIPGVSNSAGNLALHVCGNLFFPHLRIKRGRGGHRRTGIVIDELHI